MPFPEDCTSQIGSNDGWVNKDLHAHHDQPSGKKSVHDRLAEYLVQQPKRGSSV
jgi:hypothetical protein